MPSRGSRPCLALLAAASVGLGACSWTQGRPAERGAPPPSTGAPTAAATPPAPVAPAARAEGAGLGNEPPTPVEIVDSLLFRIENVQGASAAAAGVAFAPVQEPVERCLPPRPGVLRVLVASESGRASVQVAPGSDVDPTTRQCMIDALASIDVAAVLAGTGTPSADARRFASTVNISW